MGTPRSVGTGMPRVPRSQRGLRVSIESARVSAAAWCDETSGQGRTADDRREVPATGWRDIVTRTVKEAKADGVSLLAAGVAFFFLLALGPSPHAR